MGAWKDKPGLVPIVNEMPRSMGSYTKIDHKNELLPENIFPVIEKSKYIHFFIFAK